MKYLSLKTVVNAYTSNMKTTRNKLWGVLGILSAIPMEVKAGVSYAFATASVSEKLESIFNLSSNKKNYTSSDNWYVMFSKSWIEKIQEQMLKGKGLPKALDVAVWLLRNESFDDNATDADILQRFVSNIHISQSDLESLFDVKPGEVHFVDEKYSEEDLLAEIKSILKTDSVSVNVTAEGDFVAANPGELSRAPFVQPLYASQKIQECMLITPFDFTEEYISTGVNIEKLEGGSNNDKQTIFYGCPGTGKSHTVAKILKNASKGVVKVAETTENRSLNFHQYLKEQPYFSTGDAYHFALKSRGKKSLYNVILERGLADGINSCFDITDIETLKKIQRSINENNPFPPRHQEAVYAIEYYIKFLEEKPSVQLDTEFRTTFHPDSDYASFVGCYKPTMIEGEDNENRISYEFVPQVFTNAYVRAWELYNSGSKENVYLVIEEINRGNCAQIFGDLFQLLDRYEDGDKAGFSKYEVDPDADLSQYLIGLFDKHHCAKKLCLPPNLHILATMNTSDQSLFPMDSAFKRRWSWKYVPIDYEHKDSSKYTITIGDRTYSWNKFLQDVNERIKTITQSEDKQIGNFFIAHADIKQDEFINKVMFYLWSEICKDNYKTRDNFFRNRNNKDEEFSFNDLFGKDATALLQGFMAYIAGEDAKVVEEQEESHEVEG